MTHTFLVLVTVGLGHGVYRKMYTFIGGQRAEKFENHWCRPFISFFAWFSTCFFFAHRPNFFNDRKKLSQFGHNHVRIYRLVKTVSASFNAVTAQMTEMSQRKKIFFSTCMVLFLLERCANYMCTGKKNWVSVFQNEPKLLPSASYSSVDVTFRRKWRWARQLFTTPLENIKSRNFRGQIKIRSTSGFLAKEMNVSWGRRYFTLRWALPRTFGQVWWKDTVKRV